MIASDILSILLQTVIRNVTPGKQGKEEKWSYYKRDNRGTLDVFETKTKLILPINEVKQLKAAYGASSNASQFSFVRTK